MLPLASRKAVLILTLIKRSVSVSLLDVTKTVMVVLEIAMMRTTLVLVKSFTLPAVIII